jgi:MFS family permease
MYLPAVVAAAGVFGPRRSLALAIVVSGSGAGQVLLGPLIGELLHLLGWRGAFRAVAGICVGCAGLGLLMPTPRPASATAKAPCNTAKASSPWATRLLGAGVAGQAMVPVFLLFGAGDALAVRALYIPYSVLPGLAVDANISPALASLLIAALGEGSGAGRLAAGSLCDKPWCHPLALTRLTLALAAPFPLLLALSPPSFPLLAGLCCALGLLTGGWISATSPLLVSLLGVPHLGTAFGRLTAVRGLAALASPPLAAVLASTLALPTLPLHISAGLFAAAALTQSVAITVFHGRHKRTLYEQL